jgi:hypothetical protein
MSNGVGNDVPVEQKDLDFVLNKIAALPNENEVKTAFEDYKDVKWMLNIPDVKKELKKNNDTASKHDKAQRGTLHI